MYNKADYDIILKNHKRQVHKRMKGIQMQVDFGEMYMPNEGGMGKAQVNFA